MTLYFNTAVVKEGGAEPVIESLNITPSAQEQLIEAPSGVDGYSPITVEAAAQPVIESLPVTPSNVQQTFTASGGVDGYSPVIVNAAPQPVIESLSVTPTTSEQIIRAPEGVDGYSPITVAAVTVTEPDITFEFIPQEQQTGISSWVNETYQQGTVPAMGIIHINKGAYGKVIIGSGLYPDDVIDNAYITNSDIIITVDNGAFRAKGECIAYRYDSGNYEYTFSDTCLGQAYVQYHNGGTQYKYYYEVGCLRIEEYTQLSTSDTKGFMYCYGANFMGGEIEFEPLSEYSNGGYSFDITVNQDGSFEFSNFEFIPPEQS